MFGLKSTRWIRLFFFQAEDGIRDDLVTGVQTCALPISVGPPRRNGRSCGRPAQVVDFARGRESLGGIGGREVRDGLSERAGHGSVRNCSLRAAQKETEAVQPSSIDASKTMCAASEGYAKTSLI